MGDRRAGGAPLGVPECPRSPRWLDDAVQTSSSRLLRLPGLAVAAIVVLTAGALTAVSVLTSEAVFAVAVGATALGAGALLGPLLARLRRAAGVSSALLRGLEASGEGVVLTDADGRRVLWANESAAAMAGRTREELAGTDPLQYLDAKGRAEAEERRRLRAAGHAVPPHYHARSEDAAGGSLSTESVTLPVDLGDHRLQLSLIRDVTAREAVEARARADQALATAVLDTVASAVVVTEPDGRIVLVNPTFRQLSGRPASELIGRYWDQLGLIMPGGEIEARAAIERVLDGEPRAALATPWKRSMNDIRQIEWMLTAVREGGRARYLVAAGVDVTARRAVEARLRGALQQLEARTQELERLNDELEQFASIASHDLREPLRAIAGFSELLDNHAGEELDERATQFLRLIRQAAARMDALLDALSRYGRAGRAEAPAEPVDLEVALAEVLESLAPQIADRGAEVTHADLPTLPADRVAVQQVLQNLIANGIKFNESECPRVHVEARPRGDDWELTVRDNGIGIPAKERDRVFEMFRRLHPRDAYPGTGAGLAIVQRIVERQGGRIWVDEAAEGGSEFHVVLRGPAADPAHTNGAAATNGRAPA